MPRPDTGRKAVGWASRLALVVGGVSLAAYFGLPRPALTRALDDEKEGRGRPGIPASPQARASGHETEDMSGGTMARLVVGLGFVVALMVAGMVGLRYLVLGMHAGTQAPLTAEQTTRIAPPAPNLQANPPQDLDSLHAAENRLLDNYAWIDPAHTRGRIPIDRAMTLIVGQPLDTAP